MPAAVSLLSDPPTDLWHSLRQLAASVGSKAGAAAAQALRQLQATPEQEAAAQRQLLLLARQLVAAKVRRPRQPAPRAPPQPAGRPPCLCPPAPSCCTVCCASRRIARYGSPAEMRCRGRVCC